MSSVFTLNSDNAGDVQDDMTSGVVGNIRLFLKLTVRYWTSCPLSVSQTGVLNQSAATLSVVPHPPHPHPTVTHKVQEVHSPPPIISVLSLHHMTDG